MATIRNHFGITGPVPFLDVELTKDNRLFVDPHRIRIGGMHPIFAAGALACLDSFLTTIFGAVRSGDPGRQAHARLLLDKFSEPRETRLGLARHSSNGHGGAQDIGARMWIALSTDVRALLQVTMLKHLEELPLFVKGIRLDLTSDITTRIIFGPLADFTAEMMLRHPELVTAGEAPAIVTRQIWDSSGCVWTKRDLVLPVADGKPILLVPKAWAGKNLLMTSERYHGTTLLSHVQGERATRDSNGKVVFPRKVDLRQERELSRGRETNIDVTLRALDSGVNLLHEFRNFVADKFDEGDGPLAA